MSTGNTSLAGHWLKNAHSKAMRDAGFAQSFSMMCERINWRAQGDDFRTFLGQLVAASQQFELPSGLNL